MKRWGRAVGSWMMPTPREPTFRYSKVIVRFERRADGGLRASSEDVPGFVLSHASADAVLSDVKPALEGILSHMLKARVEVEPLGKLRAELCEAGVMDDLPSLANMSSVTREYVTHIAN